MREFVSLSNQAVFSETRCQVMSSMCVTSECMYTKTATVVILLMQSCGTTIAYHFCHWWKYCRAHDCTAIHTGIDFRYSHHRTKEESCDPFTLSICIKTSCHILYTVSRNSIRKYKHTIMSFLLTCYTALEQSTCLRSHLGHTHGALVIS